MQKKRKLLIVTTVSATLRAFMLPYAGYFRAKGWQVDALSRDTSEIKECVKEFDSCHDLPFSRKPWQLRSIGELKANIRSLAERERYDIVHVHTPVASFVTRMALKSLPAEVRPKVLYTAHGFHFYEGGLWWKNLIYRALERKAGEWTDHTIVINNEDYQAAIAYNIADEKHLSLLPGIGLDFERYSPSAVNANEIKKLYSDLSLTKNDELFLMAAEFNPGKRHKDAIRALAAAGKQNFHLALAGKGPLEDEMKKLVSKLGIERQVHFLGLRTDVPLLMLASRATIMPSEREGLNRSVMESLCLGIPVLGADSRGIRDLITGPERGALFPVGNYAALAAAMILAVVEPCAKKPEANPEWSIQHLLKEHEKLYEKVLKVSAKA